MNEIIRNLLRRKMRSGLTVSGIVIGIFALTTMGSLAEHFNSLLDVGVRFAGTSIPVKAPAQQQNGLLPLSKAGEIVSVPGVAAVYPTYQVSAEPAGDMINLSAPPMILNEQRGVSAYGLPVPSFASGRDLAEGARGEVVLGSTMAATYGKHAGDTIELPRPPENPRPDFVSHTFEVVGVMAKTGTPTDSFAEVGDADARMLLADTLPPAMRSAIDVNALAQGFAVYAAKGTSLAELDAIAQRINDQVPGVETQKPSALVANFKSTSTTFTAVFTGAALLALLIGGLSVVNTMIMAVGERVREIGLKKAVGAHTGQVLREYLLEAAVIGAIGGVAGYAIGVGLTSLLDAVGSSSGFDIFLVTPRLSAIALGFAVAMATLAGVLPAFRAARLDPVAALRSL
ncbi:MAG TPA: ABC transporter permease [Candidatus Dormibacteraeota bacterium]|nr:ABC transporter permease [Candidatus Dormibacteraeota bacterium]